MFKTLKNHPLVTFYVLAFALAWCIKIPVVLSNTDNIVLRLLPSFFPAIAALVTAAIIAGRRGVGDVLRQVGKLRVSPIWYLIALIGPMVLNLLAIVLALPFGEAFPKFTFPGIRLLPVILVATFFALGEELGWRGFALPRLQGRFNALIASLIIGLLWWAWHLPEALGGPAAGLSLQQSIGREFRDLLLDVAASILITWIYNSTGGSVLLATLFHVGLGLLAQFLPIPNAPNVSLVDILFIVILCSAAAIIVLRTGPAYLTQKKPGVPGVPVPANPTTSSASTVLAKDEG